MFSFWIIEAWNILAPEIDYITCPTEFRHKLKTNLLDYCVLEFNNLDSTLYCLHNRITRYLNGYSNLSPRSVSY